MLLYKKLLLITFGTALLHFGNFELWYPFFKVSVELMDPVLLITFCHWTI